MTDIYAAPPRPRLTSYLQGTLRESLGKRDLVKGERGALAAFLQQVSAQANRAGFYPDAKPMAGDSPLLVGLRRAKLDHLLALFITAPEQFSPDEIELLPRILEEAVHDFRPRAGHARGTTTDFKEAVAERERLEAARAKAAEPSKIDELAATVNALSATVDKLATIVLAHANASAPPPRGLDGEVIADAMRKIASNTLPGLGNEIDRLVSDAIDVVKIPSP